MRKNILMAIIIISAILVNSSTCVYAKNEKTAIEISIEKIEKERLYELSNDIEEKLVNEVKEKYGEDDPLTRLVLRNYYTNVIQDKEIKKIKSAIKTNTSTINLVKQKINKIIGILNHNNGERNGFMSHGTPSKFSQK